MVSQIFKLDFDNQILWNLLSSICEKKNEYYLINKESFKRGHLFSNNITEFYNEILPHYHHSKKHYLENALTYKKFLTIIRQVCKNNNILFRSEIKYMKSTYEIIYYIYHNPKL
jgi:hypothetical protein